MSEDDYSATVLGSHWFSGPPQREEAVPDRVEGSVVRFGPGVTAAMPAPFPVTAGPAPAAARRRSGGWRRYSLAALVLLAVLGYLGWQRYGPSLGVRDVSVRTAGAQDPGCGATADVVAVVRTDGRPGTLVYQWVRSDGTRSERLTEWVPRGRKEARLHLLWTFRGPGSFPARAELRLISPDPRSAAAQFTYHCAG